MGRWARISSPQRVPSVGEPDHVGWAGSASTRPPKPAPKGLAGGCCPAHPHHLTLLCHLPGGTVEKAAEVGEDVGQKLQVREGVHARAHAVPAWLSSARRVGTGGTPGGTPGGTSISRCRSPRAPSSCAALQHEEVQWADAADSAAENVDQAADGAKVCRLRRAQRRLGYRAFHDCMLRCGAAMVGAGRGEPGMCVCCCGAGQGNADQDRVG
jgi:hypothetical protein